MRRSMPRTARMVHAAAHIGVAARCSFVLTLPWDATLDGVRPSLILDFAVCIRRQRRRIRDLSVAMTSADIEASLERTLGAVDGRPEVGEIGERPIDDDLSRCPRRPDRLRSQLPHDDPCDRRPGSAALGRRRPTCPSQRAAPRKEIRRPSCPRHRRRQCRLNERLAPSRRRPWRGQERRQ